MSFYLSIGITTRLVLVFCGAYYAYIGSSIRAQHGPRRGLDDRPARLDRSRSRATKTPCPLSKPLEAVSSANLCETLGPRH